MPLHAGACLKHTRILLSLQRIKDETADKKVLQKEVAIQKIKSEETGQSREIELELVDVNY
jgi:hypothetical protein